MNFINQFKIGKRLLMIFLTIIVMILINAVYVYNNTNTLEGRLSSIYNIHLLSIDFLIEADRDSYQSDLALSQALDSLNYSNSDKLNKLLASVEENRGQVEMRYSKFAEAFGLKDKAEYKETDATFWENYKRWTELTNQTVGLIKNGNYEEARQIYYNEYDASFEAMRNAMDVFTGINLTNSEQDYNLSLGIYKKIQTSSFIILVIIALFVGLSGTVITRSITIPLLKAVKITKTVAEGNLKNRVTLRGNDETTELLGSIKLMSEKLLNIVANIKEGSEQILSGSQQLSVSAEQVASSASEQASSVEEVSASIEEIVSSISLNNANAVETEKIARKAANEIEESLDSANQTMMAMKQISEKIQIINDIAFQTNILALNAAVEAARAGEQGKGFAVVASEVRKLAERSRIAADEIHTVSESSVHVANKSKELLSSIVPDVQKTAELVKEISVASAEQNIVVEQINKTIQGFNAVAQQNSATSEELSSSAEEMTKQASVLNDAISYFEVDEH